MLMEVFERNGFKYGWSGFTGNDADSPHPDIYGYWFCSNGNKQTPIAYMSTTLGWVGTIKRGEGWPLDDFEGGRRLYRYNSEEEQTTEKAKTLQRLIDFVDKEALIALDK